MVSYEAEIRRTTHGVAHIRAEDWASLGFGQGYACAVDHLPVIADQIVKVRGERARYWGPGPEDANVASDFGYLVLGVLDGAARLREHQPPRIRDLVRGYVAGYNRRVGEVSSEPELLPEWCRGAEWIRPIDELDLYAYLGDIALLGSGRNLAGLIGRAEAPGPNGPVAPSPLSALSSPDLASNGWAVGGDVTASGGGMILANPHFPWYGEARFWECHLTLPGELDVYGVCLLGAPGVQMGFNRGLAWAHTFSCGFRFTVQRLDLVPGEPTAYHYGAQQRPCIPEQHRIVVRTDDGELETVERTLWRSHHGPMLNLPLVGWGLEVGFSYRDANIDNLSILQQFLGMDQATDLDSFRRVYHEVKGLPWVNTLAADSTGRIWYADASATPRISAAAQARFAERIRSDVVAALLVENRVALLDGSDPDDEWLDHPDARSPGIEPPQALPEIERRDVLANANDSYWLPHPTVTIEDHSVLCGFARTARSFRTRQNLLRAAEIAGNGSVTLDDLLEAVFDNRSLTAELLLDDVVARCRSTDETRLHHAADVLERWDRCADLDSVGVTLWREVIAGFPPAAWLGAGALMAEEFDPRRPLETPARLATPPSQGPDPVLVAVGAALDVLVAAGVRIDAPLREVQWADRGGVRVPVHGGGEAEGLLNVLAPVGALPPATLEPRPPTPEPIPGRDRTGLGVGGYQVSYGTSFLMAVELLPDGPRGFGLLAYGQSSDPRSPHHHDGTEAYAQKRYRQLLFTDEEIEADGSLTRTVVRG